MGRDDVFSFGEALVEAVKGLKGSPPFLFVVAVAIVLVGAGSLGVESLRALVVPISVLAVVVTVAWVAVSALKIAGKPNPARTTGGVRMGAGTRVGPNATVQTGDVKPGDSSGDSSSGKIETARDVQIDGHVKTGSVDDGD